MLSRLRNTTPGRLDVNWAFVQRVAVYGVLPLLAVIASLFPEIGNSLFGWLETVHNCRASDVRLAPLSPGRNGTPNRDRVQQCFSSSACPSTEVRCSSHQGANSGNEGGACCAGESTGAVDVRFRAAECDVRPAGA